MNKQSLEQQTEDLNRLPEDTPGQRIRKLRLKAGYSQKELSDMILELASGKIGADELLQWIIGHTK